MLLTVIARTVDALPLAASMPSDEQTSREIQEYQSQAKMLFRKLTNLSPLKCTIESGAYVFHYSINEGVCYLVLVERSFPKRHAFAYLEDITNEFVKEYGMQVAGAVRPYCFIEFDNYMQKAKKNYTEGRGGGGRNRNLTRLNDELQGVQRIMMQNIDDVLQRGENLQVLDDKAGQLRFQSEKYKKDAKFLNMRTVYAKYAAVGIFLFILGIYVRYWWL